MMCDADVCSWITTTRLNREFKWNVKQAPERHRIQIAEGPVLDPCAKQIYFRRDPKVDPLRIESGPSWRARFGSLHLSDVLKFCRLLCGQNIKPEATYTNSIRGRTLELGRPEFASPSFLVFEGLKIDPPKRPPGRRSWHGWERGTQCHQNTMSGREFYGGF